MSSDWHLVGDATTATDAPPPYSATSPVSIDVPLLEQLLPGKESAKLAAWVKVLHDEEILTVQDAAPLLQQPNRDDWNKLPLPLAVRAALFDHFTSMLKRDAAPLPLAPPSEPPTPTEQRLIQQLDCIVLDVSQSMKSRSTIDALKTREDVSKLMFHTMVDRILGLEMNHALSLVAFGQEIAVVKGLTLEYEAFHDEMGRLDARQGATKLFDAIAQAAGVLTDYALENKGKLAPDCQLRVFALTDGEDNSSRLQAYEATRTLQSCGIILDAFPMGPPNPTLQAMATATGGYCVTVTSEEQGVGLFEREALLHVAAREEAERTAKPEVTSNAVLQSYVNKDHIVQDVASSQPRQLLQAAVMKPQEVEAKAATATGGAQRRIMKEYVDIQKDKDEQSTNASVAGRFWAFMTESDIFKWKLIIQSPKDTVYGGAYFVASVVFPSDYPFKPPMFRFATPIYHCNINKDGGVCLDILKDHWSPALTISKVAMSMCSLMSDPNPADPLDAWKAQLYNSERSRYESEAKSFTARHAFGTLEEAAVAFNIVL